MPSKVGMSITYSSTGLTGAGDSSGRDVMGFSTASVLRASCASPAFSPLRFAILLLLLLCLSLYVVAAAAALLLYFCSAALLLCSLCSVLLLCALCSGWAVQKTREVKQGQRCADVRKASCKLPSLTLDLSLCFSFRLQK
jgi:hypothetical protein